MNERFRGHITQKAGEICDKVFNPFLNYMDGGEPPNAACLIGMAAGVPLASIDIAINIQNQAAEVANNTYVQAAVPGKTMQSCGPVSSCDTHPEIPNPDEKPCCRLNRDRNTVSVEAGKNAINNEEQIEFQAGKFCEVAVNNPHDPDCQEAVQEALVPRGIEFPLDGDKVVIGDRKIPIQSLGEASLKAFVTTPGLRSTQASELVEARRKEEREDLLEAAGNGAKCSGLVAAIVATAAMWSKISNKRRNNQEVGGGSQNDSTNNLQTLESQIEYEARVAQDLANSPSDKIQFKGPRAYL